jgi:hypothetical protein
LVKKLNAMAIQISNHRCRNASLVVCRIAKSLWDFASRRQVKVLGATCKLTVVERQKCTASSRRSQMQGIWKFKASPTPFNRSLERKLIFNNDIRQALQRLENSHDLFKRKTKLFGLG